MVSPLCAPACVMLVTDRGVRSRSDGRLFPRMPNEPDHLLLRRYAVARDRGRDAEAAQIWERLAENNFDRIKILCRGFRFPSGPGLPRDDADSAASEAYLRVIAMGAGFRGGGLGQLARARSPASASPASSARP